jgi:hypothetical protein
MKVWRLESREGLGVFAAGAVSRIPWKLLEGGRARDPYRHPDPESEGLEMDDEWFCGFASLEQYKIWFNTKAQRAHLTQQGVRLKLYDVPSRYVKRGKAQTIFVKEQAKHIASRKPSAV